MRVFGCRLTSAMTFECLAPFTLATWNLAPANCFIDVSGMLKPDNAPLQVIHLHDGLSTIYSQKIHLSRKHS